MKYVLGMGITNDCNAYCKFCYSRNSNKSKKFLTIEKIKMILDNLEISSINLGTGESGLHPEFKDIISLIKNKNIKLGLTTNGYTVSILNDRELDLFDDIDFSLDFPTKSDHDLIRGTGFYDLVLAGIERCKNKGIVLSIVACMMNINYKYMSAMLSLARSLKVNLRINIYKPVNTNNFKLSYEQFWKGIKILLKNSDLISCSEPIINAAIGNNIIGFPCGENSIRITPEGEILPCVYWKSTKIYIDNLIKQKGNILKQINNLFKLITIPSECFKCKYLNICKGGCAARRLYNKGLEKPDEYCFVNKGDNIELKPNIVNSKKLIHSDYLCTIIVK